MSSYSWPHFTFIFCPHPLQPILSFLLPSNLQLFLFPILKMSENLLTIETFTLGSKGDS